jgi:hypothetical protein
MNDLRGPRARKCLGVNDLSILYFRLASELKFNYILNMDKKQRGRKKGSVSFMQVELNELNRILKPDAKVILSIRYAQLVGLNGKPVSSNLDVLSHCVASGKAEMQLVDFDEEEQDVPAPNANKKKDEIKDDDHISTQAELETFDENEF